MSDRITALLPITEIDPRHFIWPLRGQHVHLYLAEDLVAPVDMLLMVCVLGAMPATASVHHPMGYVEKLKL